MTPVILVRTKWNDTQGLYFGFKGGRPMDAHGHMDSGTFVFDSDGVRWASDLGPEDYSISSKYGLVTWDVRQNSVRWDLYRNGIWPHNTLSIDGQKINVSGLSNITKIYNESDNYLGGQIDITENYFGKLEKVTRDEVLIDEKYLSIVDSITGGNESQKMTWTMTTKANATITDAKTVTLSQSNKKCILSVLSPSDVVLSIRNSTPPKSYESQNTEYIRILINTTVRARESKTIKVTLTPQ